jgi:VWFA-related protein
MPQNKPAATIRQVVRRVVVDVVVTDAGNNPVAGLGASDFSVSEDGKPQTILHFDFHNSAASGAPSLSAPALPPHTFMNLPAPQEDGPLTVFLYDLLNTPLSSQMSAHQQVVEFLKTNPAKNRTAIFVLSDRLHLLEGFTADREALLADVNSKGAASQSSRPLQGAGSGIDATQNLSDGGVDAMAAAAAPGKAAGGAAGSSAIPLSPIEMLARAEALEAAALLDQRVDATREALDEIARFVSAVPGRKNLVWLSGSFPAGIAPDPGQPFNGNDLVRAYSAKLQETADLLNASQVAVYPVDVRGLIVNPMYSAASSRTYQPGSGGSNHLAPDAKAVQDFIQQQAADHGTMDLIGERTGGRAFYNTNGLDQAMQAALLDGSNYYSLEYAPTNAIYDGSVRRIKVTMDRPGLRLAYRRTYFADDLASGRTGGTAAAETAPVLSSLLGAMQFGAPSAHELIFAAHIDAMGPPAPATREQMDSVIPFLQAASRNAHERFVSPQAPLELQRYAIRYAVLAKQLDLPVNKGTVYTPDLTFAVLAFDSDGVTLAGLQKTIQDAIPASRIADVERDGYRMLLVADVPVSASWLRIAVEDDRTGRIGSMELRLPLPPIPPPSPNASNK